MFQFHWEFCLRSNQNSSDLLSNANRVVDKLVGNIISPSNKWNNFGLVLVNVGLKIIKVQFVFDFFGILNRKRNWKEFTFEFQMLKLGLKLKVKLKYRWKQNYTQKMWILLKWRWKSYLIYIRFWKKQFKFKSANKLVLKIPFLKDVESIDVSFHRNWWLIENDLRQW